MNPRPVTVLAGRDAAVYDLLRRVVAIGRHRRAWDAADVARVAYTHLPNRVRRDAELLRRRAEAAEAEVERLTHHPHRTVTLSALQADIVARACRGATPTDIALATGRTRTSVANHLSRAAAAMQADHVAHGLALVQRGVVEIRVKPAPRRRRTAGRAERAA